MNACRIWIQAKIPDAEWDRFREAFPSVQFLRDNEAETQLESLDAAFADDPLPEATVQQMKNLKWLHVSRGGTIRF